MIQATLQGVGVDAGARLHVHVGDFLFAAFQRDFGISMAKFFNCGSFCHLEGTKTLCCWWLLLARFGYVFGSSGTFHAPCGGLSPQFQRVGLCEVSSVESLEVTATPGMSAVRGGNFGHGSGLLGPLWASDGLLDGCRMWLASLWSSSGSGGLGPNRVILAMTFSAKSCPLAWLSSAVVAWMCSFSQCL